ncbi:hypothetical protein [uncultured Microbacterium sp.]|uniref:hypothetical protein n=1 Tax=uncultured Microbacterium sp. TaxID=191216 RepID=UPI0025EB36A9|nr:hypothetical protein [uncultured Microbacterium sp.]
MDITLPTIPAGVLVLLALVAPYAIGALNGVLPFVTKPWQKKVLAVLFAVVLGAAVLAFYFVYTGDTVPNWPTLLLLGVVVVQASYALFTKSSASAVEAKVTPGETLRRDQR